ncbi:MAG: hypothetical protein EA424_04670 [Planctomycetaceae bacterium]|nr:MAG: hypothetical protein EA424_04670 [Planctomycetaceae bacterium]
MNGLSRRAMLAFLLLIAVFAIGPVHADDAIRPYEGNPYYWQYKGRPVLLLGGSDQDNLFNHPDIAPDGLEAHLDLLRSVGGNTVRNTMSTREAGNLFAFHRDPDTGLYDLDRFHDAYWQRLDTLLALAKARDIIVQIELWDPHDYYRPVGDLGGWAQQPFNPANNINYTFAESGLIETVDWSAVHDPDKDHPFFQTVPAERDLALVRRYQERFVDKVLEVALPYPNVLYCVSNESNDSLHWSDYWAEHLRRRAAQAGRPIQVGEMRFPNNPRHADFQHLIARHDLYAFLDMGQLNRPVRQTHWDNLQYLRGQLAERPRPINNTKIYGGDQVGWTGGYRTGEECFWRNVLGGAASARFHRPPAGRGLSPPAQGHIRSARMMADRMDFFSAEPRNDLLSDREANVAYLRCVPGRQYAVYFPDGGAVKLDVSAMKGRLQVHWLEIARNAWQTPRDAHGGGTLELNAPGQGHWAVLILARQ